VRHDDPPSPRLPALLLAALAGFALLIGAGAGMTVTPVTAEVAEEAVGGDTVVDRRVSRAERRVLPRRVSRHRRRLLRSVRRSSSQVVRTWLEARSHPLRGPPLLATA